MKLFKRLQKSFITGNKKELPVFKDGEIVRYHIQFEGIVQGVGFRFEVYQMANQFKLSGWVRNEMDGSVLCEVEGTQEKIEYLIKHLKQVPRFQIEKIIKKEISLKNESSFRMSN